MGQLLSLEGFFDYQEFVQLSCEVSKTTHDDNKTQHEAGSEGALLRGILIGGMNPNSPELTFTKYM